MASDTSALREAAFIIAWVFVGYALVLILKYGVVGVERWDQSLHPKG